MGKYVIVLEKIIYSKINPGNSRKCYKLRFALTMLNTVVKALEHLKKNNFYKIFE